ncbi:MAG: DUF2341 domain-containing protein, partial [Candidatus Nanoarchaeia archaeon]|nr:DUF2341 domain-containing protein [Candidatus Jingweiarchaeum tengchongense]
MDNLKKISIRRLIFILVLLSILNTSSAWLQGWDYRREITIDNTNNPNTLTDYQVNITLDTQTLISQNKLRENCADLRFTDSDTVTNLNYFIIPVEKPYVTEITGSPLWETPHCYSNSQTYTSATFSCPPGTTLFQVYHYAATESGYDYYTIYSGSKSVYSSSGCITGGSCGSGVCSAPNAAWSSNFTYYGPISFKLTTDFSITYYGIRVEAIRCYVTTPCNSSSTTIFVKVPLIPANSNKTIYVYYGNSSANIVSNAANTFIREIDGLKASWNFDEGGGSSVFDSSGNSNNGTLYNGVTWTAGKFGSALNFDGVNDYVLVQDSETLRVTDDFSFEAWIYPYSFGENVYGRLLDQNSTEGYIFYVKNDSGKNQSLSVGFGNGTASSTYDSLNESIYLNTWQHVIVTFNKSLSSNQIKFFVNNVARGTATRTTSVYAGTSNLYIGNRAQLDRTFNGTIDEVRIYNKSLSTSEIADLYNNYGFSVSTYPEKVLVRKYTSPEPVTYVGTETLPYNCTGSSPPSSGNWLVSDMTSCTCESGGNLFVNGSIYVLGSGKLTIENCTLEIRQSSDYQFEFKVDDTASVNIKNTIFNSSKKFNSTFTGSSINNLTNVTFTYPYNVIYFRGNSINNITNSYFPCNVTINGYSNNIIYNSSFSLNVWIYDYAINNVSYSNFSSDTYFRGDSRNYISNSICTGNCRFYEGSNSTISNSSFSILRIGSTMTHNLTIANLSAGNNLNFYFA